MGRSQRHMLYEHNYNTIGELFAQGVVAPVTMSQVEAGTGGVPFDIEARIGENAEYLSIPIAPPGGPLSGSTMSGAIPVDYIVAPTPPTAPVLSSLNPATVQVNAADLEVHAMGGSFIATSVVNFNGSDVVTSFYSEYDVGFFVSPTAHVAGPVDVFVRNVDGQVSATLPFTFTA